MKSKPLAPWLISGFVIIAILAIGFFVSQNARQNQPTLTPEERAAIHAASIEGRFETVLNDFLETVSERTRSYNKKRKIIEDLIRPENLRSKEYIEENRAIAQEMIPAMNTDIADLLAEFDMAETRIKALAHDAEIGNPEIILSRWETVKKEQLKAYSSFFSFEQERLDRIRRLLEIYFEGRENYRLDLTTNTIVLNNARLQARADILLGDIRSLREAQSGAMN